MTMTVITSRFSRAVGPGARRAAIAAVALAPLAMHPALAAESGVSLQDGWMRILVAARPAAGYFTLSNESASAKVLNGASSPDCSQLMLHESLHDGGQERMVMVKQVTVPPHGTLSFAPGGYHLMCMQPAASIQPGGTVPVTLRFADGGSLTADFAVRGAVAK
jgi:copper(I)-binding protein